MQTGLWLGSGSHPIISECAKMTAAVSVGEVNLTLCHGCSRQYTAPDNDLSLKVLAAELHTKIEKCSTVSVDQEDGEATLKHFAV